MTGKLPNPLEKLIPASEKSKWFFALTVFRSLVVLCRLVLKRLYRRSENRERNVKRGEDVGRTFWCIYGALAGVVRGVLAVVAFAIAVKYRPFQSPPAQSVSPRRNRNKMLCFDGDLVRFRQEKKKKKEFFVFQNLSVFQHV